MAKRPFHNPFGALRERLPALRDAERKRAAPPTATPAPPPIAPASEADLWAEATSGVRPIDRGPGRTPREPQPRPLGEVRHPDLDAFEELCALVRGDAPFDLADTEEYVEGRVAGLDPGVVRKLRRGEYAVQGHVDLHGLTRQEAKGAVDRFLKEARAQGKRCVLLVHGRGLHSKDQLPVLKEALRGWLGSARFGRHVLAFASARPEDGGAGALYVLLRRAGR